MFFRSPYADALIVVLVLLLFFGPKRLPALGKSLGQGMREFKESITGQNKDDEAPSRPELNATSGSPSEAAPGTASTERESAEVRSQPRA